MMDKFVVWLTVQISEKLILTDEAYAIIKSQGPGV